MVVYTSPQWVHRSILIGPLLILVLTLTLLTYSTDSFSVKKETKNGRPRRREHPSYHRYPPLDNPAHPANMEVVPHQVDPRSLRHADVVSSIRHGFWVISQARTHLSIWAISSGFTGSYLIVNRLSIPMIMQPQCFGLLSTISVGQCLYYSKGWKASSAVLFVVGFAAVMGGFEVGSVYALSVSQICLSASSFHQERIVNTPHPLQVTITAWLVEAIDADRSWAKPMEPRSPPSVTATSVSPSQPLPSCKSSTNNEGYNLLTLMTVRNITRYTACAKSKASA